MSIPIKPCPFCGSTSVRVAYKDLLVVAENELGQKKIKAKSYVMCNKCFARSKPFIITAEKYNQPYELMKKTAIENWNKRSEKEGSNEADII